MINKTDDELTQILWDFNNLCQSIKPSDCILVLGSNDVRTVDRAVELYFSNYAPIIIFSGGVGRLTPKYFKKSEAEFFSDRAIKLGVPKEKIYIENQSTNTGQNILFSKKLIEENNLKINSIILVQNPYSLRRSYATFKKQWPGIKVTVTGPKISLKDYPNELIPKNTVINMVVGDTQRIKLYPKKGFQILQIIPKKVWDAYKELVSRGYTDLLLEE